MKTNYNDILGKITGDTPLETVAAYCDTVEDFEFLIANVKPTANTVPLTDDLVEMAAALVKNMNPNEITTAFIQKNLNIGYPKSAALCDLLKAQRYVSSQNLFPV